MRLIQQIREKNSEIHAGKDILSGIIVALVSIPISMGYAQIAGKYNTSPKDKLIMDMMYIEQFSIVRDIQLMFQTLIVLLKSDSTEAFKTGKEEEKYIFFKRLLKNIIYVNK